MNDSSPSISGPLPSNNNNELQQPIAAAFGFNNLPAVFSGQQNNFTVNNTNTNNIDTHHHIPTESSKSYHTQHPSHTSFSGLPTQANNNFNTQQQLLGHNQQQSSKTTPRSDLFGIDSSSTVLDSTGMQSRSKDQLSYINQNLDSTKTESFNKSQPTTPFIQSQQNFIPFSTIKNQHHVDVRHPIGYNGDECESIESPNTFANQYGRQNTGNKVLFCPLPKSLQQNTTPGFSVDRGGNMGDNSFPSDKSTGTNSLIYEKDQHVIVHQLLQNNNPTSNNNLISNPSSSMQCFVNTPNTASHQSQSNTCMTNHTPVASGNSSHNNTNNSSKKKEKKEKKSRKRDDNNCPLQLNDSGSLEPGSAIAFFLAVNQTVLHPQGSAHTHNGRFGRKLPTLFEEQPGDDGDNQQIITNNCNNMIGNDDDGDILGLDMDNQAVINNTTTTTNNNNNNNNKNNNNDNYYYNPMQAIPTLHPVYNSLTPETRMRGLDLSRNLQRHQLSTIPKQQQQHPLTQQQQQQQIQHNQQQQQNNTISQDNESNTMSNTPNQSLVQSNGNDNSHKNQENASIQNFILLSSQQNTRVLHGNYAVGSDNTSSMCYAGNYSASPVISTMSSASSSSSSMSSSSSSSSIGNYDHQQNTYQPPITAIRERRPVLFYDRLYADSYSPTNGGEQKSQKNQKNPPTMNTARHDNTSRDSPYPHLGYGVDQKDDEFQSNLPPQPTTARSTATRKRVIRQKPQQEQHHVQQYIDKFLDNCIVENNNNNTNNTHKNNYNNNKMGNNDLEQHNTTILDLNRVTMQITASTATSSSAGLSSAAVTNGTTPFSNNNQNTNNNNNNLQPTQENLSFHSTNTTGTATTAGTENSINIQRFEPIIGIDDQKGLKSRSTGFKTALPLNTQMDGPSSAIAELMYDNGEMGDLPFNDGHSMPTTRVNDRFITPPAPPTAAMTHRNLNKRMRYNDPSSTSNTSNLNTSDNNTNNTTHNFYINNTGAGNSNTTRHSLQRDGLNNTNNNSSTIITTTTVVPSHIISPAGGGFLVRGLSNGDLFQPLLDLDGSSIINQPELQQQQNQQQQQQQREKKTFFDKPPTPTNLMSDQTTPVMVGLQGDSINNNNRTTNLQAQTDYRVNSNAPLRAEGEDGSVIGKYSSISCRNNNRNDQQIIFGLHVQRHNNNNNKNNNNNNNVSTKNGSSIGINGKPTSSSSRMNNNNITDTRRGSTGMVLTQQELAIVQQSTALHQQQQLPQQQPRNNNNHHHHRIVGEMNPNEYVQLSPIDTTLVQPLLSTTHTTKTTGRNDTTSSMGDESGGLSLICGSNEQSNFNTNNNTLRNNNNHNNYLYSNGTNADMYTPQQYNHTEHAALTTPTYHQQQALQYNENNKMMMNETSSSTTSASQQTNFNLSTFLGSTPFAALRNAALNDDLPLCSSSTTNNTNNKNASNQDNNNNNNKSNNNDNDGDNKNNTNHTKPGLTIPATVQNNKSNNNNNNNNMQQGHETDNNNNNEKALREYDDVLPKSYLDKLYYNNNTPSYAALAKEGFVVDNTNSIQNINNSNNTNTNIDKTQIRPLDSTIGVTPIVNSTMQMPKMHHLNHNQNHNNNKQQQHQPVLQYRDPDAMCDGGNNMATSPIQHFGGNGGFCYGGDENNKQQQEQQQQQHSQSNLFQSKPTKRKAPPRPVTWDDVCDEIMVDVVVQIDELSLAENNPHSTRTMTRTTTTTQNNIQQPMVNSMAIQIPRQFFTAMGQNHNNGNLPHNIGYSNNNNNINQISYNQNSNLVDQNNANNNAMDQRTSQNNIHDVCSNPNTYSNNTDINNTGPIPLRFINHNNHNHNNNNTSKMNPYHDDSNNNISMNSKSQMSSAMSTHDQNNTPIHLPELIVYACADNE